MIRLVPISAEHDVIYQTDCFAFFNTTTERFIKLAGTHVFEGVEDLTEAWNMAGDSKPELNRLTSKISNTLTGA